MDSHQRCFALKSHVKKNRYRATTTHFNLSFYSVVVPGCSASPGKLMEEATVTCFIPDNIKPINRLTVYHDSLHSDRGEYLIILTLVNSLVNHESVFLAFCFCDYLPNSCYSSLSTHSFFLFVFSHFSCFLCMYVLWYVIHLQ